MLAVYMSVSPRYAKVARQAIADSVEVGFCPRPQRCVPPYSLPTPLKGLWPSRFSQSLYCGQTRHSGVCAFCHVDHILFTYMYIHAMALARHTWTVGKSPSPSPQAFKVAGSVAPGCAGIVCRLDKWLLSSVFWTVICYMIPHTSHYGKMEIYCPHPFLGGRKTRKDSPFAYANLAANFRASSTYTLRIRTACTSPAGSSAPRLTPQQ